MKRLILTLFLSLLLLGSCSTTVAKREKSLVLQTEAIGMLQGRSYEGAVSKLKQALVLEPNSEEARYNLLLALLAAESYDEAIVLSDGSSLLFPANLNFSLAKAYALRKMGKVEQAFTLYQEIVDKDKANYSLQAKLMELSLEEGVVKFAKERALYLISVHQEEARAFTVLATLEGEESWYALARDLMKEASTQGQEQRPTQSR
ncbi:hypothetical protein [Sphaerochaeta sp. PS]|uniref:tetratricopeptide repeat protein n=1 Tax=Sphaerochaeta sp. PS TaxID=3076336 RepID=UPI0028A318B2|nr:hypothetical protein [Sphaerochaeta sp. PS]MDT4761584.1 hypothetical protein [Sphaerochaeta sp. PS]